MKTLALMAICSLAVSACQGQTTVTNDGVVIGVGNQEPKPTAQEPKEIAACRAIWTNAQFRCENRGDTNLWQCIVMQKDPSQVQIEKCRQAIQDCGWKLPIPKAPTGEPPPRKPETRSESFHKDNRTLLFTWSDDGVRLRVVRMAQ